MRELDRSTEADTDTTDVASAAAGKGSRTARLQRKATGEAGDASAAVAGVAGASGAPLPDSARAPFEASLGTDLSAVRVHDSPASHQAAEQLGARAFTTGQDVHFAAGQYQPADPYGMHLLAHEVAHTVQQGGQGGAPQGKLEVSSPDDPLEHEADRAADAMVRGEPTAVSAGSASAQRKIHRSEAGDHAGGPSEAPPAGGDRPTLRVGSRGAAVEELQRALSAAGHACAVDGAFGPATRAAVVAFQRAHGLSADGVVGPMTWGALGSGAPAATPAGQTPATPAGQPAGGAQPATPAAGGDHGAAPAGAAPAGAAPAGGAPSGAAPAGSTGPDAGGAQTPAGPAAGGDQGAAPASANPTRAAIVSAARGKIGTVYSDMAGPADETGDKTRHGWETLTEIFSVAYPSFPKQIIKYIKHGKNNGQKGSSPNGLPSWCGIFATWAVMTGGGNCGEWKVGGGPISSMSKITSDPKPGDVAYFNNWTRHHCIVAAVDGSKIETIDGNSYDSDSGGNGAITSRWRSRSEISAFFRQVDD